MKSKFVKLIGAMVIAVLVLPSFVAAQSKPVNVALFNPIQIFPENNSIAGLRINLIYGRNVSMVGLDWGLVNSVGSGGFTGLQYGLVNYSDGSVTGFQGGGVNIGKEDVTGFQWGWYNSGEHVSGFQLGLVNSAGTLKGLQIGIINLIRTGGFMPVFPIVNFSF